MSRDRRIELQSENVNDENDDESRKKRKRPQD